MKTPKTRSKMNYFDIENNFLTVTHYKSDVEEVISALNDYIESEDCERLSVDISALNMIDAVKTGAICSTCHFTKYPFGSLEWIVKDIETKNSLKMLSLKTVKTAVKMPIIKDFYQVERQKIIALR